MKIKPKHKKRANPPVCWICDRKLYAGGWQYELIEDEAGNEHPVHVSCARYRRAHG